MAAKTLEFDEAVSILRELVAERGESFVYLFVPDEDGMNDCVYFEGITPSCGVGVVLGKKGITPLDLERGDNNRAWRMLYPMLSDRGILEMDQKTSTLLRIFQSEQDGQRPYGEALETALSEVSRVFPE
jgi:hypothetical protein